MNRIGQIILLAVLTSACITGGGDGVQTDSTQQTLVTETTAVKSPDTDATVKPFDLRSALASNFSFKCTYTYEGEEGRSLISEGKYRSRITLDDKIVNSISDGELVYTWIEGEHSGSIFNVSEIVGAIQDTRYTYSDLKYISYKAVDVDCAPYYVSDGMFNPPPYVDFNDVNEVLKRIAEEQESSRAEGYDPCRFCSVAPTRKAAENCLRDCKKRQT
jgi:hypothetical protein